MHALSRPFGVAVLLAVAFAASPGHAQGPATELAPPGDAAPARPATDDGADDGAADDGAADRAPDHDAATDVPVPQPPGAGYDDDVRYPVPTPERAARAAEQDPAVRISSRVTTRLRALDANLRALAARGGGNVVNAVLSLLTGGLAVTLGALTEPNDDWMSIYLYVYGGTAAARGVLDLILTPDASGAAVTYQHMPMTSETEVQARLEYGERSLRSLADQSLFARVLDASLNLAAGVAVVPLYLAPKEFEITDPLDYFLLIGAGVSVIGGIIALVSPSAAEQRWDAYRELRDRLEREAEGGEPRDSETRDEDVASLPMPEAPSPRWRLGGGPMPGGGFAGFSLTF